MREIFARLLQPEPPSVRRIAEEVSRVLRRNEEARIYHWHTATGKFPPGAGSRTGKKVTVEVGESSWAQHPPRIAELHVEVLDAALQIDAECAESTPKHAHHFDVHCSATHLPKMHA